MRKRDAEASAGGVSSCPVLCLRWCCVPLTRLGTQLADVNWTSRAAEVLVGQQSCSSRAKGHAVMLLQDNAASERLRS